MAITVEDFKDTNGMWVKGLGTMGVVYITKSHQAHNHIRARCKVGGKYSLE